MARPRKCRRVCNLPETNVFEPAGSRKGETVILNLDEYETVRLIDWVGLSQEQCSEQMGVSRTTVQLIYAAARKKPWRTGRCQTPRWWTLMVRATAPWQGC